jgi:uncharacterized membrane protein
VVVSERSAWRLAWGLVATMAALGLWAWVQLPAGARVATHFNLQGQPDDWSSSAFAFAFPPLLAAGMLALFRGVARLDPRRDNVATSGKAMAVISVFVVLVLAAAQGAVTATALGRQVDVGGLVTFGIGLMLAGMGNVLPKLRSNFFFGIRTPWTLSDEQVWARTHRFAGAVFVASGVLLMAVALLPAAQAWRAPMLSVLVPLACLAPMAWSWWLWRQRHPR